MNTDKHRSKLNQFVVNDPRTIKFVCEMTGSRDFRNYTTIGLERNGEIIAGVVYDNYTEASVFLHLAAKPGAHWCTRAFLKVIFGYAFNGLGVKRISGLVPESNKAAVNLELHLGCKVEARLKDLYPDGDGLLMRMFREECRFI